MNPFANVPPQPSDFFAINAWVATYLRPAMRQWLDAVISLFKTEGFTVQVLESTIDSTTTGLETVSVAALIRVSKGGAFDDILLYPSDGFVRTPDAFVKNYLIVKWPFVFNQATGGYSNPSGLVEQPNTSTTPAQTPAATPTGPAMTGQTVTVITPENMSAESHGGNNPAVQSNAAVGTVVPSLAEKIASVPTDGQYNPHQWNYIFAEKTGFAGPAPEAIGLAGDEVMSYARWMSAAGAWYAATYPELGGTGGTGNGETAAPASPIFSLIGAILALFGFGR